MHTDTYLTDVRQQGRWYPHPVDGRRVHHLGTMDDPVLAHRPPRSDQQSTIEIVSYDPTWPRLFRELNASWEWLRGLDDEVHGQVSCWQGGRSWRRRCA